ncbi:hypothetical protein ZOSMA_112G00620 [Zostera marina]|uniref:ATP-dependent DNA helicase n=1 Tax=Zostera marina TaxID=29655 RepID=A0A0K9Q2W0_ZOSMR|nr:hypothetical protein ZOSMA_112G00620 [Zostera marina]
MIDGELFDNLEFLSSTIRNSHCKGDKKLLWGGIQLIVSGDFFQLPPINAHNPRNEFAFESSCWEATFDIQMELTHVYRKSDSELIDFLEGIRWGQVDRDNRNFRRFLHGTASINGAIDDNQTETRLFPRTDDVRRVNQEHLRSLGKEVERFNAVDKGSMSWLKQLKYQIAPDELEICEGARVMLNKNTDQAIRLVNGVTGVITGFKAGSLLSSENNVSGVVPIVRFDSGLEVPLEVEKWDIIEGNEVKTWALSQGMTLDRLSTDLTRAFGSGMVYVALSRVTTIQGFRVAEFSPEKIK